MPNKALRKEYLDGEWSHGENLYPFTGVPSPTRTQHALNCHHKSGNKVMLIYSVSDTQSTQGYKVVVCDDHPQMRGGLRNVLTSMLGCDVVGEAATGEEALALLDEHKPDMLVLDLSLSGDLNGREVLSEIRHRHVPVKVFVHTAFLSREDFDEWFNAPEGPDGIDEKGTGDRELAIGFTQVLLTEDKYVPVRLMKKFMDGVRFRPLDCLTAKEIMLLRLALRTDYDTRDIAKQLRYSSSTVRAYLAIIYEKLGLEQHSRAALMRFYFDQHD